MLALLLFALSGHSVFASDPADPCPEHNETAGKLNAYSLKMKDRCVIQISPADAGDVYRAYTVSSMGLLMVFNGLGQGKISQTTGSRSFFLFPRTQQPLTFEVNSMGDLAIRLPSRQILRLSPDTGRIVGLTGAEVTEAAEVDASNHGGVELKYTGGLLLDCGWQMGEVAFSKPRNRCTFVDPAGERCTVGNTEIFDYSTEIHLKHSTDAGLALFLQERCPKLDVLSLLPHPDPGTPAPQARAASEAR